MAKAAGLERLQVCENARPLSLDASGWTGLARHAREIDLEIGLGCMTLDPDTVREYLERVTAIGGSMLRIVLERAGAGPLSADRIQAFLDRIVPDLESRAFGWRSKTTSIFPRGSWRGRSRAIPANRSDSVSMSPIRCAISRTATRFSICWAIAHSVITSRTIALPARTSGFR
jgi:hypothetical protein